MKNLEEALEAIKKLEEEKASLSAENKKLKADNKELNALVKEVRASKSESSSKPSFKNDDGEFEVTAASFNHNGEVITAEQICGDEKLQAELIEAKCGFIVKK